MEDMIFRGMNRDQLDKAYNNTKAVKDFAAVLQSFQKKSRQVYSQNLVKKNIPYDHQRSTTFDYFPAGKKNCPTFIFIHGGYWQNCQKEDFAFIANGILAAGINVVLAEYTLAPQASMTRIVQEIGLLLDYLQQHAGEFNITPGKVCLSGHSAGGHLTAIHRGHRLVSHAMPVSALVDLVPISLCWLNEKLALTPQEIAQFSPLYHIDRPGVPTHIHVGGAELSELIRHSKDLYHALKAAGTRVEYQEVAGCNHFSLLCEFEKVDGVLVKSLRRLFDA